LADAGIAAFDIEAATVGPRHPDGSYLGLEFFNPFNLDAFRDNIRQAAAEFSVLPRVARQISMDVSGYSECNGVTAPGNRVLFDSAHFFLHGHSTGSSIGDLVLGVEPAYQAGLLTGAGGSWLYNVVLKQDPFPFAGVMSTLLGFAPGEQLRLRREMHRKTY
jgi:hypothetical protein